MQLRRIKLRRKALAFVPEYLTLKPLKLVLQRRDRLGLRLHKIGQLQRA